MKPSAAHSKVKAAIKRGELIRPENCELCGLHVWQLIDNQIVAHHWRGYEYPLDVWWVCTRCNVRLHGKHDGSLSKHQAQQFINDTARWKIVTEPFLEDYDEGGAQ